MHKYQVTLIKIRGENSISDSTIRLLDHLNLNSTRSKQINFHAKYFNIV